jgi:Transposase DDE domain
MLNRYLDSHVTNESSLYEKLYLNHTDLPKGGYILFDDTVLDKRYSRQIAMVRRQYSGNVKGVVQGIGVVVMVYYVASEDKFYLLGYRLFDPDLDGKTKVDHVMDLLKEAEYHCVGYIGVLMDSWYAIARLFQQIHHLGKYFYCPIKSNRLVKHPNDSTYSNVSELKWTKQEKDFGKTIKVKDLNLDVRVFQVPVSTDRTDWILTNDLRPHPTDYIAQKQKMRWNIENFNREIKQLTGIAKCQCRKAAAQRTHIFCAMLVWHKLKQIAYQTFDTIYQVKYLPLKNFLIQQLKIECPKFA